MHRETSAHTSDEALLAALLDAPFPSGHLLLSASVPSIGQQQPIAFHAYTYRIWIHQALSYVERALLVAALLIFGFWLIDDPVRDWLHLLSDQRTGATSAQLTAQRADSSEPPAVGLSQEPSVSDHAQPATLPFVTDTEHSEGEHVNDALLLPGYIPLGRQDKTPQPQRLMIPAISLDTPVVQMFLVDGVWQVAEYAAGYMSGTALPGEGNTALAGHAGIYGAVFRNLGRLQPGDIAVLDTDGWRYEYRVREALTVWPEQVEVLDPTLNPVLTLITCVNWDTQRLIVVADLISIMPIA